MRKPHTKFRAWLDSMCVCGVPIKAHGEYPGHEIKTMTYERLAELSGVSLSTLQKLGALDREPRTGTAMMIQRAFPEARL